jgi:hypothetical protein
MLNDYDYFAEIMLWLWLGLYLAGLVICVIYRRLARGMWLLVLGMGGITVCSLGWRLLSEGGLHRTDWGFAVLGYLLIPTRVLTLISFGLILIGLAVVFRDVRRRFHYYERALLAKELEKEDSLPEPSVPATSITQKP